MTQNKLTMPHKEILKYFHNNVIILGLDRNVFFENIYFK